MKYFQLWIVMLFFSVSGFSQSTRINPHPEPSKYIGNEPIISNDTSFDVKHYHIDVAIAVDSPFIKGNVTYLLSSKEEGLQELKLDLDSAFDIDSVSNEISNYTFENNVISIEFKEVYDTGEHISFTVFYSGKPVLAGGYKGLRYETHSSNEPIIASLSTPYLAHTWWPCKDGTQDKADSTFIDITIKDTSINNIPLIAVSNGILDEISSKPGFKTFKWRHKYPAVPYYIMVAISNYKQFEQEFVGDNYSFPMNYYVFDWHINDAKNGVAQMPDVMDFFTQTFGPYPFKNEGYGMTQLGYYGGIENQTNSIVNKMNNAWFGVSVHELAHQWFADMITCETWNHGWLNEGFATYAEALYEEHAFGFTSYQNYVKDFEYFDGGKLYQEDVSNPFTVFQSIIYNKGAFTLHMLRGVLGDSIFFQSIYDYANDSRFKYDLANTEDFQAICEATSGLDLDFFFSQWIYDERYPIYQYNYEYDTSQKVLLISLVQTQRLQNWRSVFEMPIELKIEFEDQTDTTIRVWNDKRVQTFSLATNKSVERIVFNPDNWVLAKAQYAPGIAVGTTDLSKKYFKIFPNPSSEFLNIEFNTAKQGIIARYSIVDLRGKVLINSAEIEDLNTSKSIDISFLNPGIYFIRIETKESSFLRKFVKK